MSTSLNDLDVMLANLDMDYKDEEPRTPQKQDSYVQKLGKQVLPKDFNLAELNQLSENDLSLGARNRPSIVGKTGNSITVINPARNTDVIDKDDIDELNKLMQDPSWQGSKRLYIPSEVSTPVSKSTPFKPIPSKPAQTINPDLNTNIDDVLKDLDAIVLDESIRNSNRTLIPETNTSTSTGTNVFSTTSVYNVPSEKITILNVQPPTEFKSKLTVTVQPLSPPSFTLVELPYLTKLENEIANEINIARTQPRWYADLLVSYRRPFYEGTVLRLPGAPKLIQTREGAKACEEAINFLNSLKSLEPIRISPGVSYFAKQSLIETAGRGGMQSNSLQKIKATGRVTVGRLTELMSLGEGDAREMIVRLIISDGDTNRSHRSTLFDPRWKVGGVAAGEHPSTYQKVLLIPLLEQFTE